MTRENFLEKKEQKIKPNYISEADFNNLKNKIETLDSETLAKYRKIDSIITEKLVKYIENFLNQKQITFLQNTHSLVPSDPVIIKELFENRDKNINSISDKSYLNGKFYSSYLPEGQIDNITDLPDFSASQFWNGRISVVPEQILPGTKNAPFPDHNLLMSDEELHKKYFNKEKKTLIYNRIECDYNQHVQISYSRFLSCNFAAVSLHERIHSVQDSELPLPILEAATHHYESEILKNNNIPVPRHLEGMISAGKYWEKLRKKYGIDLDKLVFQNLENNDELLKKLSADFTEEKIKENFPGIAWKTD